MRLALSLAILGLVSSVAFAQPGEFEQKLEAKLAKEFVSNAAWVTDFAKAKQQAKDSNKIIFGYFTRSYTP